MADRALTLACWDYDRTRALIDGNVRVAGYRIEATVLPPSEIFARVFAEAAFDVSELSLSSYLIQASRRECAYVAIPVFVSRAFRHGGIYVGSESGIEDPKDLEGRLVGVPEYQMTMALWARGILQDEYGVDFRTIHWRTGGNNKPGRKERIALELPGDLDVAPIPETRTLNELLVAGDLDAVIAPTPPDAFTAGEPTVRRLIADPRAAEREYFRKTGLFPIMHVIGVRRPLADGHPGLAAALFRAFVEARDLAIRELDFTAEASANRLSIPWFAAEWGATRRLMGAGVWSYGVPANRNELETVCRYSHEQSLSRDRLSVEDLFPPETLDLADGT